jgi:chromosome segregation ATPase
MSVEDERLRRQVAMFGESSLNATDRWRMRSVERADERKAYPAEQERVQQERTAIVAAIDDWTGWLRGEVETLRAAHEQLGADVVEVDNALGAVNRIFENLECEAAQRDDAIRELRAEVADLKVKLAETRAAELKSLHDSLVASARMAVDTCNEVTNYNARRVETAQSEVAQREELVALQAKADALAAELERLRTHQDFKFAREGGDSDAFDLPDFLPPPRRDN